MPITNDKAAMRAALRATRRAFVAALDAGPRAALLAALADRVAPHIDGRLCVAGYVAAGPEIDGAEILARVHRAGAAICLPHVTSREAPMRFLAWQPGAPLETGAFGLTQPRIDAPEIAPDCILAPLLGFDRSGGRIGQGAAFYDRAFAAHPDALRIGLAWSVQEVDSVPMEPWDMPLDAIATECEWIA